ncbi:rRNA small subunit methyltransferase H [Clostridiaceae bacterium JG1575]|nr:rRNA small subunit methyltransferase H [Clostridiaceae bacterium JG1575]
MEFKHKSVLLQETIRGLNIKEGGIYVDCTLGGGGHSLEILKQLKNGRLIAIDQDQEALDHAKIRLKDYQNVTYCHSNFEKLGELLDQEAPEGVDGIVMDLGVSSYQLDNPERGFSYMNDAPLDMRMDQSGGMTAYDVVNTYPEEMLVRILREYGEERFSARIARILVKTREEAPIQTTFELNECIKRAIPAANRREGPHPSKRTFQAIRIEVNQELSILKHTINDGVDRLKPHGRYAIITFHSLEDRLVKNVFRDAAHPCTCPPKMPCICGLKPRVILVSRKAIEPGREELLENPRSRSAKLRLCEKVEA